MTYLGRREALGVVGLAALASTKAGVAQTIDTSTMLRAVVTIGTSTYEYRQENGTDLGNFVSTKMGVGDIMVIPAGVPHGWMDIPASGVTYLSVRPDPKYVLPRNYSYQFTKK